MNRIKAFLDNFPTQGGTVFVALVLILSGGLAVNVRLAMGLPFPTGYEPWLVLLGALAGVTTTGMVLKRATEKPEVIRAEGEAQAAIVAAQTTGAFPAADGATKTET